MYNAPFTHTHKTYRTIMTDLLIALAPVLVWSVFIFGARVLTIAVISVLSCVAAELLLLYLTEGRDIKRSLDRSTDLSAVVTGLLCAFMLPVSAPLYVPVFTALIAIGLAKHAFGGIGKNIFNPAVFAVAIIRIILPGALNRFTLPFKYFNAFTPVLPVKLVDSVRIFSPLQMVARGTVYEEGTNDMLYGVIAGNIGEIAFLMLLLGWAYLVYRKIADFRGSLAFMSALFLTAFLFPQGDSEALEFAMTETLAGGSMIIAVFACNDYTTAPRIGIGKIIFGAGAGILTVLLRYSFPGYDGALPAVLIMNAATPLINRFTRKVPYGMIGQGKKSAKK